MSKSCKSKQNKLKKPCKNEPCKKYRAKGAPGVPKPHHTELYIQIIASTAPPRTQSKWVSKGEDRKIDDASIKGYLPCVISATRTFSWVAKNTVGGRLSVSVFAREVCRSFIEICRVGRLANFSSEPRAKAKLESN